MIDPRGQKLTDEPVDSCRLEASTEERNGKCDGVAGRVLPKQLETVPAVDALRQQPRIRVELRDPSLRTEKTTRRLGMARSASATASKNASRSRQ
jgi:hypothetical protein